LSTKARRSGVRRISKYCAVAREAVNLQVAPAQVLSIARK